MANNNGNPHLSARVLVWVLGVCGSLLIGLAGFLLSHTQTPGHPVMLQRARAIERDIDEIKSNQDHIQDGIGEIMIEQARQGDALERIERKLPE